MKVFGLDEISTEKHVVINEVLPSALTDKLTEMGLYKGKLVSFKFKAPFGDPIAIEVDGALLSLRLSEAKLIKVSH